MSTTRAILLGGVAVIAALGGGYWLGRSGQPHKAPATNTATPPAAAGSHTGHDAAAQVAKERQILFYQHPDGNADYSPVPKDRKSTRLNSSHNVPSRMPSSA